MKKLFVLLFSLLISFNSYANEACIVYIPYNTNQMLEPTMLAGKGNSNTDIKEIKWDKLLSVCNVGDVVKMGIIDYSGNQSLEELEGSNDYAWDESQYFIQGYCDLKETVIINNITLVCRLVELRKFK